MKKINLGIVLFGLIFFLAGIGVAFGGVMIKRSNDEFMKTAIKTEGYISDIETYREWDSTDDRYETKHRTYVTYEVDGEIYENIRLSYYSSDMYVGKDITLYYDPLNHGNVKVKEGMTFTYIFMLIFGGIFALVGFFVMTTGIKRTPKIKKTGKRYEATVIDIECNTSVKVNGKHPYRVICRVEDYSAGEAYIYKSKNVYVNLNQYELDTVPVYVDPNKPSKFFVDVDEGIKQKLNATYNNGLQVREFE